MQQRNVEGIRKFSERKTSLALQKAENAIERLMEERMKINFNTVSREAGVSKPFLYTHPMLRIKIEDLRRSTESFSNNNGSGRKRLEKENAELRKEIRRLQIIIRKSKL